MTQQFINFITETGEILSVGPSQREDCNSIEVELELVKGILTFKENMNDYIVVFDTQQKVFALKKINAQQEENKTIIDLQPYIKGQFYDVLLRIFKDKVKVVVSDEVQKILDNTNVNLSKNIYFSVTEKDNPDVLFELLSFDLTEKNVYNKAKLPKDFSIFTRQIFASYAYEVIDE